MSSIGMVQHGKIITGISILEALEEYSFRSLNEIRHRIGILSDDYGSKKELAQIISETIEAGFWERVPCLDYKRYKILKGITEGGDADELCDERSLFSFSICDMAIEHKDGRDKAFVLPDELFEVFEKLDSDQLSEKVKKNTESYDLINGCLVSYGLINVEALKTIIEHHIGQKIGRDDFQKSVDSCELVHGTVMTVGNMVISRMMKPDRIKYFSDEQEKVKEFDYKKFTREELVHAADIEYIPETQSYWKLMSVLKRHFSCSEELCRISTAILINYAKACRTFDDAMEYIILELGLVSEPFMGEFIPIYAEYNNCTSKWALKGNTPNEITSIKNPELMKEMEKSGGFSANPEQY